MASWHCRRNRKNAAIMRKTWRIKLSVSEIVSLSIAIISLIVSIYVVIRDQSQKRFDLLITMYDRLESSNEELQHQTIG